MCNTHLIASWERRLFLLLVMGLFAMQVWGQDNSPGVQVNLERMPFNKLVQSLAKEANMKLVLLTDNDTMVEQVHIPNPTPIDKIIAGLTKSIGLDFWQEGDTYYIGKRQEIQAVPPGATIDNGPNTQLHAVASEPTPARSTLIPATGKNDPVEEPEKKTLCVRKISLNYVSARDLMWSLGVSGIEPPDKPQRRALEYHIHSVLDPQHPNIVVQDPQQDSTGGNGQNSTPWLTNYLGSGYSRQDSATDNHQGINPLEPPRAQPGGGRFGPGAGNAPGAGKTATKKLGGGPLASFMPDGIVDIIGLIGLNALLVRADSDDAIDQLESLIKLLDQPVKYVLVEAMFVEMSVKDAFEIGASWEFAGMPISIVSSNGGGPDGNFSMQYLKGSLKAALSTLMTNTQDRVVEAPRVVVANGGTATVQTTDSIPFITVQQSEDVFGRTLTTPTITMQDFPQGLTVNNVLIHPDDTVTMDMTPQLTDPGVTVGIPGGAGGVAGQSQFTVQTSLRVKSGETMMMGGFVSKNETMGGTQDPLLSELPILGPLLFRNKTRSTNNTETMIFVTPTILKEDTTDFGPMQTLPPLF